MSYVLLCFVPTNFPFALSYQKLFSSLYSLTLTKKLMNTMVNTWIISWILWTWSLISMLVSGTAVGQKVKKTDVYVKVLQFGFSKFHLNRELMLPLAPSVFSQLHLRTSLLDQTRLVFFSLPTILDWIDSKISSNFRHFWTRLPWYKASQFFLIAPHTRNQRAHFKTEKKPAHFKTERQFATHEPIVQSK